MTEQDEFSKRFDALEEEFRKAHGTEPTAIPVPGDDDVPFTFGALFSDDDDIDDDTNDVHDTEASAKPRDFAPPKKEAAGPTNPEKREKQTKPTEPNENSSDRKRDGYMARSSRKNQRQRQRKKQKLVTKILKGLLSAVLIAIIVVIVVGLVYVYGIIKDTPKYKTEEIASKLALMSTMYDDQGTPMKNIYLPDGQRELITFDQLQENTVDAFIAIEDKTFWTHKGFNTTRIVGAVLESVKGGGGISGTSTITQQLARNMWLVDTKTERSLTRKIQEAYYARQIEKDLSKEEILTDYLNSIAFGNHSYGIQAAAQSYFGKEVEDLDLIESAALASLPKGPSEYAMIITVTQGEVAPDDPGIILAGSQYIYLYSDKIESRLNLVLSEMLAQGYITQGEYDTATADNIRSHLHPTELESDSNADFFSSYAIENIADDLLKRYEGVTTRDEAMQMIYSGGLDIYTTFNQRAQDIATEEYSNPENFPTIDKGHSDDFGNLKEPNKDAIMLFKYENMFQTRDDGSAWFYLNGEGEQPDFTWNADGTMTIYAGHKLGVYRTNSDAGGADISLEFRDFYRIHEDDGFLYMTKGGYIPIPKEYKGTDADGNLLLAANFFTSDHNIFETDESGGLWIGPKHYTLRQEILQPQSAFVLIDHTNGWLKAMVGGRGEITGQMNYNRALSPRQPGSTMKPLGVYGPAIEMSANKEPTGSDVTTYGPYWSPMSIIIDEQIEYQGKVWPKNWYNSFRGPMTMRKAVQESVNVTAVKVQLAIGNQRSINFLKKLGITTLVESGDPSDLGPGALALGGMTKGLTPLEIASAYGTFANAGVHITPTTYTVIKNKKGEVLLESEPERTQAMDPGTAFIVNDILRTTISNGIASAASVKGTQVAGKTGTADSNFDAWFVGNTPKYSSAIWIGGDVSVRMSQGSAAASRLFSKIMTRLIEGEEQGEYPPQPQNVVQATVFTGVTNDPELPESYTDYFIEGTVPEKVDFGIEEVDVCSESGYLATPWCEYHELRKFSTAKPKEGEEFLVINAPTFYCHLHNLDPAQFPPNPLEEFDNNFGKSKVPDLVGLSYEDAVAKLNSVHLVIGEKFVDENWSSVPAGYVISQNPAPGKKLEWNFAVNVTVSKGPEMVTVPDIVGWDQAAASVELGNWGLVLGELKTAASDKPPGVIIKQKPAAGKQVARGTAINCTVSSGP
jgi:penicillin-binding protein 1A